jgi:hypothetical protein
MNQVHLAQDKTPETDSCEYNNTLSGPQKLPEISCLAERLLATTSLKNVTIF